MALLNGLALLLAAISPPQTGLGYLAVAFVASAFAGALKQRVRMGIAPVFIVPVLAGLAFVPPVIPYAACRYDDICRGPGDWERATSFAVVIGVPMAAAILVLMFLSFRARRPQ